MPSASVPDISIENLLQAKELEVKSLLEVTIAINNNVSAKDLFKIYEFILRAQIGIEKLGVYLKEDSWSCVLQYGEVANIVDEKTIEGFSIFEKVTLLKKGNELYKNGFEYVIPIIHKEKPLAYVLLGKLRTNNYGNLDGRINFIQTITNIIIVAIENKRLFKRQLEQEAMKKELEFAAQMQTMLVPDKLPSNEFLEADALYQPHHNVGGDYYDVISLTKGRITFCIADISGKGIPAALLMANLQASLRILVQLHYPLDHIIKILNERIFQVTKGDKFITMFIATYNCNTHNLEYVNAGHNPPILMTSTKKFCELEKGSTLLGVFDELPEVQKNKIKIEPGSLLIQYTDGLTEQEDKDGEQFGIEKLKTFMSENTSLKMNAFNEKLLLQLNTHRGVSEFGDDVTLVSTRFH